MFIERPKVLSLRVFSPNHMERPCMTRWSLSQIYSSPRLTELLLTHPQDELQIDISSLKHIESELPSGLWKEAGQAQAGPVIGQLWIRNSPSYHAQSNRFHERLKDSRGKNKDCTTNVTSETWFGQWRD